MSDIDKQIDAAVPLMKARAAELNHRTMDEYEGEPWYESVGGFIARAVHNLHDAEDIIAELVEDGSDNLAGEERRELLKYLLDDLCDAPNLCALALSLLEYPTDV